MQIALRPVAVRAVLLLAGILLGLLGFLTAFAATTTSHGHVAAASQGADGQDNDGRTLVAGTHWR
jgi:hypothetical protein